MSVIASKRKESSVQFVTTARDLLKYTVQRCLKLPKRLTFFISTDLVKCTQDLYKDVIHIKNLYAPKNGRTRYELCMKCLSRLDYLSSMLDVLKTYASEVKDKQYEKWQEIISLESILLKGLVKTIDKQSFIEK